MKSKLETKATVQLRFVCLGCCCGCCSFSCCCSCCGCCCGCCWWNMPQRVHKETHTKKKHYTNTYVTSAQHTEFIYVINIVGLRSHARPVQAAQSQPLCRAPIPNFLSCCPPSLSSTQYAFFSNSLSFLFGASVGFSLVLFFFFLLLLLSVGCLIFFQLLLACELLRCCCAVLAVVVVVVVAAGLDGQ